VKFGMSLKTAITDFRSYLIGTLALFVNIEGL
jgi:hypothetical protein